MRRCAAQVGLIGVLAVISAACGMETSVEPSSPQSVAATSTSAPITTTTGQPDPALDSEVRVAVAEFSTTIGSQPDGFVVEEGMVRIDGIEAFLARTPQDLLAGSLVPWVVPGSDGLVYYTSWEEGRNLEGLAIGEIGGIPTIRRVSLSSGVDEVFRTGAYAPAAAPDGRVAFVEDLDGAYRYSVPNPNRIVVVDPVGREEVWTSGESERYVTVGWAGTTLIAYLIGEGEHITTYAFTGADARMSLSDGGVVVAISPDGSRLLLVEPGPSSSSTWFVIADVTGRRLAETEFDTDLGPVNGSYQGDWEDDRIVLGPGVGDGISTPYRFALTIVNASNDELRLEHVLGIELPDMISLTDPRFTGNGDVWMRTAFAPPGKRYSSQDWICTLDGVTCQPVSEPEEYVSASPIVGKISGGAKDQ